MRPWREGEIKRGLRRIANALDDNGTGQGSFMIITGGVRHGLGPNTVAPPHQCVHVTLHDATQDSGPVSLTSPHQYAHYSDNILTKCLKL